jgi:putative transposase
MGAAELRWVRQLEDENRRLKTLIADLTLDKHMLQQVLRKTL